MRKRNMISLLIIVLFIFVFSNDYYSSVITFSSRNIVDINTLEADVYIYQTAPITLDAANASTIAKDYFDLEGNITKEDDIYQIITDDELFQLFENSGAMFYADFSQLHNITYDPTLLDLVTCLNISDTFLESTDFLSNYPYNFLNYGSNNVTSYNVDTEVEVTKVLAINLNYGYEIDGIPIGGPGGSSSVTLGHNGELIGFYWIWRDILPYTTVSLLDFQTVLDLNGISDYQSVTHELKYYTESAGIQQDFIYPIYDVELTYDVAGDLVTSNRYLPATNFNPKITITSPDYGDTFAFNDGIIFNSSILHGTAPYTYEWSSNIEGFLSDQPSFTTEGLTVIERDNVPVSHVIELVVYDNNNLISTDSIEIIIESSSGLFGFELLTLIALGVIGILAMTTLKQRRNRKSSLLIGLILISFLLSPTLNVHQINATIKINTPNPTIQDYSDDSVKEYGIEYLTYSADDDGFNEIELTALESAKFNIMMTMSTWTRRFYWAENNAWEKDFKDVDSGGLDYAYIDAVDIALFAGHGSSSGIYFISDHDDSLLSHGEANWGDGDLEYLCLDACQCLAAPTVFDHWIPAFNGLHSLLGWHSNANDVAERGIYWPLYMKIRIPVITAWTLACKFSADSNYFGAAICGSSQSFATSNDHPFYDQLHGFGTISDDVANPTWFCYYIFQC